MSGRTLTLGPQISPRRGLGLVALALLASLLIVLGLASTGLAPPVRGDVGAPAQGHVSLADASTACASPLAFEAPCTPSERRAVWIGSPAPVGEAGLSEPCRPSNQVLDVRRELVRLRIEAQGPPARA